MFLKNFSLKPKIMNTLIKRLEKRKKNFILATTINVSNMAKKDTSSYSNYNCNKKKHISKIYYKLRQKLLKN